MDIQSIAKLAKLSLGDTEKKKIQSDIEEFAHFAKILNDYAPDISLEDCNDLEECGAREDIAEEFCMEIDGFICVPLTVEVGE